LSPEYVLIAPPERVVPLAISPISYETLTLDIVMEQVSKNLSDVEDNPNISLELTTTEVTCSPPPRANASQCSGRTTRPPRWTKDYVCTSLNSPSIHHVISFYVSFYKFSLKHRCCISNILEDKEPSSYNEASSDP